jgi:hypothetical protein
MAAHDRIRLTGLLRKKPWKQGFFYVLALAGASVATGCGVAGDVKAGTCETQIRAGMLRLLTLSRLA